MKKGSAQQFDGAPAAVHPYSGLLEDQTENGQPVSNVSAPTEVAPCTDTPETRAKQTDQNGEPSIEADTKQWTVQFSRKKSRKHRAGLAPIELEHLPNLGASTRSEQFVTTLPALSWTQQLYPAVNTSSGTTKTSSESNVTRKGVEKTARLMRFGAFSMGKQKIITAGQLWSSQRS